MDRIKRIESHPKYGVKFVVCGNAEVLGINYDGTGYTRSEAELAVCQAGGREIMRAGYNYEVDSIFRNWNGGRHDQFATLRGHVAVYVYLAEPTDDEDADDTTWQLLRLSEVPGEVLAEVERVWNVADTAMTQKIEEINAEDAE